MASVVSARAVRAAGASAARVRKRTSQERGMRTMHAILAQEGMSVREHQGETMGVPEEPMVRPGVVDLVSIRTEPALDPGPEGEPLLGVLDEQALIPGAKRQQVAEG